MTDTGAQGSGGGAGRPDVSVVIPTHSAWPLLEVTLGLALAQEGVEVEVIVVDDGSTDETPQRLAEIADPRVRSMRNDPAQGPGFARNRGLAEARGSWVAFLDQDDLWAPHKLRALLDAAAASGASWAYSSALAVDDGLRPVGAQPGPPAADVERRLHRFNAIPGGCSNVVASTEALRAVDGFDAALKITADWDLWLRLARHGAAASVPEPLLAYVEHGGGLSATGGAGVWRELEVMRGEFGADFDPDGVLLSRWVAGNMRRAGARRAAAQTYLRGAVRFRNARNVALAVAMLAGEGFAARHGSRSGPVPPAPPWLSAIAAAAH